MDPWLWLIWFYLFFLRLIFFLQWFCCCIQKKIEDNVFNCCSSILGKYNSHFSCLRCSFEKNTRKLIAYLRNLSDSSNFLFLFCFFGNIFLGVHNIWKLPFSVLVPGLSLHWEVLIMLLSQFPLTFCQTHNRMPCLSHSLWLFPCWLGPVLMIISETFHGKISLNSVVLLLILDFVSGYRLEYPSSSEVSDQARLISMVFSCCHSSLESFFFSFVPTE